MVQKTSRKAKSAMKGFGHLVATTGAVATAGIGYTPHQTVEPPVRAANSNRGLSLAGHNYHA